MGVEIERKWLPDKAWADRLILQCNRSVIEQGYLCTEPVIRVRKEDLSYYMTYKGKGGLEHTEYNLPLNKEAYETLLTKCDGRIITKERYRIPFAKAFPGSECCNYKGTDGELMIELDVFHGKQEGLYLLEVEFADRENAEAFAAPVEFGPDVTGRKEYTNACMAEEERS